MLPRGSDQCGGLLVWSYPSEQLRWMRPELAIRSGKRRVLPSLIVLAGVSVLSRKLQAFPLDLQVVTISDSSKRRLLDVSRGYWWDTREKLA